MLLSKTDRILIGYSILPMKDTFENMLLARDIKNKTKLSKEENEAVGFKTSQSEKGLGFFWDDKDGSETEIEITEAEQNYLKARADEISKAKDVTEVMINTVKKIRG